MTDVSQWIKSAEQDISFSVLNQLLCDRGYQVVQFIDRRLMPHAKRVRYLVLLDGEELFEINNDRDPNDEQGFEELLLYLQTIDGYSTEL